MAIGYACNVIGVQDSGLSRCLLKNAVPDNIKKLISLNLNSLENIINYNVQNGINLYRISSDIIPFGSHFINNVEWWSEYEEILLKIGMKISNAGIRISMHPGQYTVLNSTDHSVVQKALNDLKYHAAFLNALKLDNKNKIILHIGGIYGNKAKATDTFINNYLMLEETIKNRLVIENDDKNYNIKDVLSVSKEINTPVVFDNLHHELNPPDNDYSEFEWIEKCSETWKVCDGKQKIHYSQQKMNAPKGAHSDTIYINEFLKFYKELTDKNIDIMLEVKDKNLSAIKCNNTVSIKLSYKEIENEWERYKYFVLSRSESLYIKINHMVENGKVLPKDFYEMIEKVYLIKEDKNAEIDTANNIWKIIKNRCSISEKKRYIKLIEAYKNNTMTSRAIKNHLLKCVKEQKIEHLINSLYFCL